MATPNDMSFGASNEKDEARLYEALVSGRARSMLIPLSGAIDQTLMSRFLAKLAIEILAQRLMKIEEWEAELIDNPSLDALRRFARVGDRPAFWPFSRRRIYGEDDVQAEAAGAYQVLHEYILLYTHANELYFVVCFFGEEFAINFGCPEIDGYEKWLNANDRRSSLYGADKLPLPPEVAA